MTKWGVSGVLLLAMSWPSSSLLAQSSLILSSSSVPAGGGVSLNLTLTSPPGSEPAGLQWTFSYPASSIVPLSVNAGPALAAAGKTISCTGDVGGFTCLASGLNSYTIGNGMIATVTVTLAATSTSAAIGVVDVSGASPDGEAILVSGIGGTIDIAPLQLLPLPPSPVSSSPPAGSGTTAAYAFSFVDSRGWQSLNVVNVLIDNFLDGRQSCYAAYNVSLNTLYLVDDTGTTLSGLTLNGSGSVANSQCAIWGTGSSAAGAGDSLLLTLNMSFSPAFGGNKVVYLAAGDLAGGNSGWQALGTWNVPGAASTPTAAVNLEPARGAGAGGTFTFTFSDSRGWQDLGVVNILINDALDGRRACYLAYSQPLNALYLVTDDGAGLMPGIAPGPAATVANSQCTVSGSTTTGSVSGSGNTLTLTLSIGFLPAFAGNRIVYMAARNAADTLTSGWQAMGSWTVP